MTLNAEVAIWEADSLKDHVALIQRQVNRSLKDPQTRQLAAKIVSHKPDGIMDTAHGPTPYVEAWGLRYALPDAKPAQCAINDPLCEIQAIWNFHVANIRYVLDPDGYDLFSTVRYTLDAGAGDCDDSTIFFGAMLRAVGFSNVFARVVSTSGEYWEHVYTMVGLPKTGRVTKLYSLDPTVPGATPGWEYRGVKVKEDFRL